RAHEDGVDTNYSALCSDHPDLFIANVALDIVVPANVRVRHDGWLGCDREDFFKPSPVNVCKINNHAEGFALTYDLATKQCQTLSRRAARRENSAVPRR